MDKTETYVIKECIKEIKNLNKEQKWIIFKSFIESFLTSFIIFGNNNITKDAYNIWKKLKKIEKEEQCIHSFIIKNIKIINFNKCLELFDKLEILNEKTIVYYLNAFEDIINACETKNEIYAKHMKKNFETLIETDKYIIELVGLTIEKKDIKEFLNFPEEFWNYVHKKIKYIDGSKTENEFFYSTLMKFDKNDKLIDIKVLIPHIIDIKTALVNVHELKHAYDLYLSLGKSINEKNPIYEETAIEKENEFKKELSKRFYKKGV